MDQPTPAPQKLETVRHEDYKELYTDSTGTSFNFFSFSLTVGRFSVSPEGQHVNEQHACIVMSPEHAKLVAEHLTANVADYEKRFGTIRTAPNNAQKKPEPTILIPSKRLVT